MKVLICGGDGYCGWPTSLYLADRDFEVVMLDNLSRRKIDVELGANSLSPIQSVEKRLDVWNNQLGQNPIRFINLDLALEPDRLLNIIAEEKPDAILHYAEQRAAPYSMKSPAHKRYTLNNNLMSTLNLLEAIVETGQDIHFIHLGSMGVYGYFSRDAMVPEGYLEVEKSKGSNGSGQSEDKKTRYLCQGLPASIYHATKMQDAILFQFYNANNGLRITDLHQGVVWGTHTEQTRRDERLINRFDYDGDYGTFINRFLMQSVIGHPITLYGKGGQCRPIIHIQDSARCLELALDNPPKKSDGVHIYNQCTEVFQIRDIASLVAKKTNNEIKHVPNPRVENEEVKYEVDNTTFLSLGLKPTLFGDNLMDEVMEVVQKYEHRCNHDLIMPRSAWRKDKREAVQSAEPNAAKKPSLEKDLHEALLGAMH